MSGNYEFVCADDAERARFADRDAILAHPHELAAQQNRARSVVRIRADGRVYYMKQFGPCSIRNRITFAMTRPHAKDDAERECLVTLALRQRGVETPRPVLRGRMSDGRSFYLCEQMPGTPLVEHLLRCEHDPTMLRMLASFCGDLLAAGFRLPDLSADHVFVRQELGYWRFGLLDLHNGEVAAEGPAPLKTCRRALRRFQRSVQSLPIARHAAMRFALRLLKRAGAARHVRTIVRGLSPMDTAARYERTGKAKAYKDRNPARTERELALLASVWPGRPGETVLDAPCGAGRLSPFLRARGHGIGRVDGAFAMLQQAMDAGATEPMAQAHALALPFVDRAFDGAVQFRFLHHLEPSAQKAAVQEACRVSRRFFVASFFHPCSVHHASRRLRDLASGRAPMRHAITLSRLVRWCKANGFSLHAHRAELPYCKDLWVASFVRRSDA